MPIKPANRARGQRMEAMFKAWLDREGVPYFYFDQTPLTVPAKLRGLIKRPDFAVGLGAAGTLALDVKALSIVDDHFLISGYEHTRLGMFENYFNIPVWFAIFPPRQAPYCYFFRNVDLNVANTVANDDGLFLRFPVSMAIKVDHTKNYFQPTERPVDPPWGKR